MKEIFFIILQLTIFVIFFSAPFHICFNRTRNFNNYIFYSSSVNFIFLLNVFLFISFFRFNLNYIFNFQLILCILLFFYFLYKKKFEYIFLKNIKLYLFFIFTNLTLFFLLANNLRLEWDGLSFWFYKTATYYQGGSFEDLKNLPYKNYPHLGSFIWAFFWKNSFLKLEYFGRLFYIFAYILSIFSVTDLFNKSYSNNFKILFCLLIVYFTYDHLLFGGYQEYLIFSILLFSSRFIYEYFILEKNKFRDLIVILFSINLLIWIKQEGIFYFSFIILFLIFNKINNSLKKIFILTFYVLAIATSVFLFNQLIGNFEFQSKFLHNELVNNFNISTIIDKFFLIIYYMFISSLKYPIWIIIFFSFIILSYYRNNSKINYLYIFLTLNIIFIFSVFFHTPYNFIEMLSNSLDRLMLQTSAFYIPLFIYLLNKYKKKFALLNNFLK